MSKSLRELAQIVEGEVEGENVLIKGAARVEDVKEGEITFAVSDKFLRLAENSRASAVIVDEKVKKFSKPIIRVKNPRLAFARILEVFAPPRAKPCGIHPTAVISDNVRLGNDVRIGPFCVIEEGASIGDGVCICALCYVGRNVTIGEGSFLHPRVTVLDETFIGKRVTVHSGAVIGSDGFGFVRREDGSYYKIPQVGRVFIEDDVEIGANVTIDRATTGETRIGRGTKIDNLVHIAHNVSVGEDVAIVALVGISGSCEIGDRAILAGQVGIADHISIGSGSIVGAKSGVTRNVPPNTFVWGIPAREHLFQKKIMALTHRLPELLKRIQRLEKLIEGRENAVADNT
ncbi:UDP-3-O-(3-hydroxymyristoyl)glucosamine N-acyltransferase [Candidatus Aerophobetes bacterium]|nr:UDP-3-O-(3-hydroxymyristoyl)glucosamine N-acyltransferase [Candidatus Aerophobetes bacterium]